MNFDGLKSEVSRLLTKDAANPVEVGDLTSMADLDSLAVVEAIVFCEQDLGKSPTFEQIRGCGNFAQLTKLLEEMK